ncbi:MAG: helix-turn-helix domain-containing protein [Kiritimatiellae bacterium]|nr:helix-turn-helix domain-containing protein [Kiritimatiellia bacterium]
MFLSLRPQPTVDTVGNRPESSQKTPQKTPQKILASIRANPFVGTQAMADMIGVERSTVARAIAKLKRDGVLRRIGPDKGGHWEVIEKLDE